MWLQLFRRLTTFAQIKVSNKYTNQIRFTVSPNRALVGCARSSSTLQAHGRIALGSGALLKGKQIVPAGDWLVLELHGGGA